MAGPSCQHEQKDVIIDVESPNHHESQRPLLFIPVQLDQSIEKAASLQGRRGNDQATASEQKDSLSNSRMCSGKKANRDCVSAKVGVSDHDYTSSNSQQGNEVQFHVGQHRQLMIGRDCQLTAISPVFESMFCERWRKGKTDIEVAVPDVETRTFGVILRCASGDTDLDLTEDTVWDVLKAADEYQVLPVVKECFHFLLHKHRQRHRSRHLCVVLEMACQLSYSHHYSECLKIVKRKAGKIFKSKSGLAELCHRCMLGLIKAEDLHSVNEILVHDAVVTWARCACAKQGITEPGWGELRATAGELVYHVRYLLMPLPTLKNLREGHPNSCLLTKEEIEGLKKGTVHPKFPVQVNRKRQGKSDLKKHPNLVHDNREYVSHIIILVGLFLLLLFAVVYFPTAYLLRAYEAAGFTLVNRGGN